MKITIKLGGPLRKKIKGHEQGLMVVDLAEGTRISEAMRGIGLEPGDVRVLMRNGRAIADDDVLVDGDRLGLFPRELAYNTMTAISFFNPLARDKEKDASSE